MLLNKYQFTIPTIKENIYGHINRKKQKLSSLYYW